MAYGQKGKCIVDMHTMCALNRGKIFSVCDTSITNQYHKPLCMGVAVHRKAFWVCRAYRTHTRQNAFIAPTKGNTMKTNTNTNTMKTNTNTNTTTILAVLNLTQHPASPEQVAGGVIDIPPSLKSTLAALLTFESLPPMGEVRERAEEILSLLADAEAELGLRFHAAMLGGAPYLMAPLERALQTHGIMPLYAFSVRTSAEETLPDGSVRKVAVFNHAGFVAGGEA